MVNKEINYRLKYLLGDNAFRSLDMQVSNDFAILVKSTNYLITQLNIIKKMTTDDELKEYIENIVISSKNILYDKD